MKKSNREGAGFSKTGMKKRTVYDRNAIRIPMLILIAMTVFTFIFCPQITALAAEEGTGAQIVTTSFSTLLEIITAMVSSVGAIILLWSFFEVGISMQSQEGSMQAMGFKKIGGGLIMTLAPQLTKVFIG